MPIYGDAPKLRAEVDRQLLEDLRHYGFDTAGLRIDWTRRCPEGRDLEFLDGRLESDSEVGVVDASGVEVAGGWIDFEHDGTRELVVFWGTLYRYQGGETVALREIYRSPFPQHVWERMSERLRDICARKYRGRWLESVQWMKDDWQKENPGLVAAMESSARTPSPLEGEGGGEGLAPEPTPHPDPLPQGERGPKRMENSS